MGILSHADLGVWSHCGTHTVLNLGLHWVPQSHSLDWHQSWLEVPEYILVGKVSRIDVSWGWVFCKDHQKMMRKCCLREISVFCDKESIFFAEKSNENETLYSGKRSAGQKWILINSLSFIQILICFSHFYFHSFLSHFSLCQLHPLWPSHSLIMFFQFICYLLWQHQTHFISLYFYMLFPATK